MNVKQRILIEMADVQELLEESRRLNDRINEIANKIMKCNYRVNPTSLTPEGIVNVICGFTGVSQNDLYSGRRHGDIIRCKSLICYILRKYTPLTYQSICLHVGLKQHSTVINHINNLERDLKYDVSMRQKYNDILTLLGI